MTKTFKSRFAKVLEGMSLSAQEKIIINERYVEVVTSAETNYRWTRAFYFLCTNFITIGGVLITAFASFDRISDASSNTTSSTVSQAFIWVVWILGFTLAICNGLLHVFNVPKRYILNYVVLEKLYSEGWSYAASIGRYEKVPEHDARFKLFCKRVEKIKQKSIETAPEVGSNETSDILSAGYDDSYSYRPCASPIKSMTISRRSRNIFTHGVNQGPVVESDNVADDTVVIRSVDTFNSFGEVDVDNISPGLIISDESVDVTGEHPVDAVIVDM